ncbi:hypothetical protein AX777_21325 [Sphingobium yanoikuyae]|jgi:hypothetical protein|uniref:Uncharacterized protein n=1 Tax=Sphingobium yanoikuyae TaxID=13690 RepID=A0A177JM65_SPHYA|nr:hypothetical protein [Sphingobium yanoikuyae]OAH41856.1 hypothetical protein AX777_21325 [Sphingobium yanoikuyae]
MDCEVCEGRATYPIHNKFGKRLYEISCPECCGTGEADDVDMEAASQAARVHSDLARYNAAMAEMRKQ